MCQFLSKRFKKSVGFLLIASISALTLFSLSTSPSRVRSASSIVNLTPSDQLLYIHGSGAQRQYGDFISSNNGGGLNTYYSYFIEVPPGLGTLQVDIFDPDFRNDGTTANRDSTSAGSNSCFRYELWRPDGIQQASALFGTTSTCNAGTPVNTNDNAWYTLATVTNPASGHWEIRVRGDSTITSGSGFNAYGIRAHDGTPGAGGTELNIYAPTFVSMGVNSSNYPIGTMRYYNFYPYVTSGCTMQIADFDTDGSSYASFDLTTRLGTNILTTTVGFSGNNVWAAHAVPTWTTPASATDYGVWSMISGVSRYTGPTQNYVPYYYLNDLHSSTAITPTAQPEPNTFRVYLPTDTGTAPAKPYVTQSLSWVSGPNPPQVGKTSVFQVQVQVVNPTGSIGAITFSNTNVVTATVPGSGVTYAGNNTVSQGSLVSQPSVGGTGNITWNAGTVNVGTTATMNYRISVVPTAIGTVNVTGTPTSNGTQATFVDETGNTTQSQARFTFGPLCGLSVNAVAPTAVMLSSFTAKTSSENLYANVMPSGWELGIVLILLGGGVIYHRHKQI